MKHPLILHERHERGCCLLASDFDRRLMMSSVEPRANCTEVFCLSVFMEREVMR